VGVYGLISFSVAQRTREIGIRVALGAQSRQVMAPVLWEGLSLALAGIAIGIAGSLAATRLLADFLFGIEPTDPLTYAGVALLLLVVALAASYIPSRRALRVGPITALRGNNGDSGLGTRLWHQDTRLRRTTNDQRLKS
jgi:putative ABC transport system permease protein